jgi:sugar (pentulose or hexulose) kinase
MHANSVVAVLDVGKTNLKLLVATAAGEPLEALTEPNRPLPSGPYLACDLDHLEGFFLDGLAAMARRHPIGAIVATAHGCGAVLVDAQGPVLPMMDYEAPCPAWLDEAYCGEVPPMDEVFCAVGPGAMQLAKQLLWQERAFAEPFGRARHYLMTPQYLAWRLGGRPATEISLVAAQGHLWAPLAATVASIVSRHGWQRLLPPFARAGERLGYLSAAVAARTGLSAETEILCGAHDSNANLYRYKAAGRGRATVLSTGTWMIGFSRDKPLAEIDVERSMVANVGVDGEPIASTLTMTGREYAALAGDAPASDAEALAAVAGLIERGTAALPSFCGHAGAFPGSSLAGTIVGPPCRTPAETRGLAALYAAFYANHCLDLLEARGEIVVDGGFAGNAAFCRLLAALRPNADVWVSRSHEGTALGAALLWQRHVRQEPARVALDRVAPYPVPGLAEAASRWVSLAEEHARTLRAKR